MNNQSIEVFRSPDNFTQQFGGRDEIILNYASPEYRYNLVPENIEPIPQSIQCMDIRLRRFLTTLHLTSEFLRSLQIEVLADQFRNTQEYRESQKALINTINRACTITYDYLVADSAIPEHLTILDRTQMVYQFGELDNIMLLVDITFYATRHEDVDYGKDLFQRILMDVLTTGTSRYESTEELEERRRARPGVLTYRDIRPSNDIRRTPEEMAEMVERLRMFATYGVSIPELAASFDRTFKKYDDKAEERASKLLEELLSKDYSKNKKIMHISNWNRFEKRGEVIIKKANKNGLRTYTIQRGSMISVIDTDAKKKETKKYRLCIEPKKQGTICPTDEIIAKIKLIMADEKKLHEVGNRFNDKVEHYCHENGISVV